MTNEKYNGWTNYETWRVNLEWFDGMGFEAPTTADACREMVEEIIESNSDYDPAAWMISNTLDAVNWYEIAEHINDQL